MNSYLPEITIERFLERRSPDVLNYKQNFVITDCARNLVPFTNAVRLKGATVLLCTRGKIECSINLKRYAISANQLMINFSGDLIQIHSTEDVEGYAVIVSTEYLQQLQFDNPIHAKSYLELKNNGPITIPPEEMPYMRHYYVLLEKYVREDNPDVIRGLAQALLHSLIGLTRRYGSVDSNPEEIPMTRAQQIFDKFIMLLKDHHDRERSLSFYAAKLCLTPKYLAGTVKRYSGKSALEWINEYVVTEAKMMLRFTRLTIQEVSYKLNFPSQSAFGKYFKLQTSMSPTRYRAQSD